MALWDYIQHQQIRQLQSDLASTKAEVVRSAADSASRQIAFLEDRVETLTLMCHAMWTLVQEELALTDNDLAERFEKLDLLDGVKDGKLGRTPEPCGECGAKVNPRVGRCLFCGKVPDSRKAF